MSTTKARRERRARARLEKSAVETMLDTYTINPNEALTMCFGWFGRKEFEKALRRHLHQHIAKVAFVLAMKMCMEHQDVLQVMGAAA